MRYQVRDELEDSLSFDDIETALIKLQSRLDSGTYVFNQEEQAAFEAQCETIIKARRIRDAKIARNSKRRMRRAAYDLSKAERADVSIAAATAATAAADKPAPAGGIAVDAPAGEAAAGDESEDIEEDGGAGDRGDAADLADVFG